MHVVCMVVSSYNLCCEMYDCNTNWTYQPQSLNYITLLRLVLYIATCTCTGACTPSNTLHYMYSDALSLPLFVADKSLVTGVLYHLAGSEISSELLR